MDAGNGEEAYKLGKNAGGFALVMNMIGTLAQVGCLILTGGSHAASLAVMLTGGSYFLYRDWEQSEDRELSYVGKALLQLKGLVNYFRRSPACPVYLLLTSEQATALAISGAGDPAADTGSD